MNIFPDVTTWHPTWCSPADCSAPDRLAERGLTEADVPLHHRHSHFSAPITIGSEAREDAVLTLALERFIDQPPAEPGVDAVELVVEHRLQGTRVVALLEPAQLDSLAGSIERLRLLAVGASPVQAAVAALRTFGAELYGEDVPALLACWRHAGSLTAEQVEQIIGAFPARREDGGR